MAEIIAGVMRCRDEGDLLPHTIPAALKKVDCLLIVDDDSNDNSWDIIKSFSKQLEYSTRRRDKISNTGYSEIVFSRQHLLDEVRRRFGIKDVWVQVIESDVAILDTDVRDAIQKFSINDISVRWHMLNACRRVWTSEYDLPRIPNGISLNTYYNACHWMEQISSYTFRPLERLFYTERPVPWPQGFSHYFKTKIPHKLNKYKNSPLLIHYGFRSPAFYYNKKKLGNVDTWKYPEWDLSSPQRVKETVYFYNGVYNDNPRTTFSPISREGWCRWLLSRKKCSND